MQCFHELFRGILYFSSHFSRVIIFSVFLTSQIQWSFGTPFHPVYVHWYCIEYYFIFWGYIWYSGWDSNSHCIGSKPISSACWDTRVYTETSRISPSACIDCYPHDWVACVSFFYTGLYDRSSGVVRDAGFRLFLCMEPVDSGIDPRGGLSFIYNYWLDEWDSILV